MVGALEGNDALFAGGEQGSLQGGFDGFRAFVQALNDQMGIPRTLSEVGADPARIDELAAMAIEDPSCGGNPVALTVEDFKVLFRRCM